MASDSDGVKVLPLGDQCKAHRARTDGIANQVKFLGTIVVLAIVAVVGWVVIDHGDQRAQGEQIVAVDQRVIAVDKRVDDFKELAIAMHQSTVEIARSVGQIEGMLKVTQGK